MRRNARNSLKNKKTTNPAVIHNIENFREGNGVMSIKQIREIAKSKGIKTGGMKKADIIRSIQRAEGNFDCFGTATMGYCDQHNCLWITSCLSGK
jgi:hypothetical protein